MLRDGASSKCSKYGTLLIKCRMQHQNSLWISIHHQQQIKSFGTGIQTQIKLQHLSLWVTVSFLWVTVSFEIECVALTFQYLLVFVGIRILDQVLQWHLFQFTVIPHVWVIGNKFNIVWAIRECIVLTRFWHLLFMSLIFLILHRFYELPRTKRILDVALIKTG